MLRRQLLQLSVAQNKLLLLLLLLLRRQEFSCLQNLNLLTRSGMLSCLNLDRLLRLRDLRPLQLLLRVLLSLLGLNSLLKNPLA